MVNSSTNAFAGRGGFIVDGGLFGPFKVADGEWYRIITAGFLHAGLLHIGFNMFLLFQLGTVLEPALGRLRFGAVYATSLLCGSLGVLIVSPNSLTVGASGAVFGLMGALFLAYRDRGHRPVLDGHRAHDRHQPAVHVHDPGHLDRRPRRRPGRGPRQRVAALRRVSVPSASSRRWWPWWAWAAAAAVGLPARRPDESGRPDPGWPVVVSHPLGMIAP